MTLSASEGIRGSDNKEKTKYLSIFKGWREDLSTSDGTRKEKQSSLFRRAFQKIRSLGSKYMVTKASDGRFVVREAGSFKPIEILATEQEAENKAKSFYEEEKRSSAKRGYAWPYLGKGLSAQEKISATAKTLRQKTSWIRSGSGLLSLETGFTNDEAACRKLGL